MTTRLGSDASVRNALLVVARAMARARLTVGTSGNASTRTDDGMLITPSGLAPDACDSDDLVHVTPEGMAIGRLTPSSEWRMHANIYASRPEAGAVVHAHSPFATALACQRIEIPPFHYMISRFGGRSIRCADYATFGTRDLADRVSTAIADRCACLLANHGMLVFGRDTDHALSLAIEFETLCEQYWRTLQLGPPILLSDDEMDEVIERFRWYGKPQQGHAP